jgi:XTP/dITP diphosphohydrolase
MRIVIATGNPHKVDEIRAVLAPMGFTVVALPELGRPVPAEPEEPGVTFEENARIKAEAQRKHDVLDAARRRKEAARKQKERDELMEKLKR